MKCVIEHEDTGVVALKLGAATFRLTLEDAENLGEGLIACVRAAEQTEK